MGLKWGTAADFCALFVRLGDSAETTTYTYNDANELVSDSDGVSYTYDDWGRLTGRDDGTHEAAYTYRYDDRLVEFASDFPTESDATFTYGGSGLRRKKVENQTTTWYNYFGYNVIAEEDGSGGGIGAGGELVQTYVHDPGKAIGTIIQSSLNDTYFWYHQDHIGSTRLLTGPDRATAASYEYTPYGEPLSLSGWFWVNSYMFTGMERDSSTGDDRSYARHYSSRLGQWHSRDLMGSAGSAYGYVEQSPIMYADFLGLFPFRSGVDVEKCRKAMDAFKRVTDHLARNREYFAKHGCLDKGHLKEAKQLESNLEKNLKRIKKYCGKPVYIRHKRLYQEETNNLPWKKDKARRQRCCPIFPQPVPVPSTISPSFGPPEPVE